MKLTKAEYKLLDSAINSANTMFDNGFAFTFARPIRRDLINSAIAKGLISKRAWDKGYVVATALGKRSHGYGKR